MISTISQLVALVESNNSLSALRTEPAYRPDVRAFDLVRRFNPGWSRATYDAVLRCSWGAFQIMGDNLYLQGLEFPLARYWSDADLQIAAFNRYVRARKIDFTLTDLTQDREKRKIFALRYNGSEIYADRLRAIIVRENGPEGVA